MATEVTDKLFEALPRLAGKVGATGVTSDSATTIPHTFVGLTEGHCYIVTANRTNAAGTVKNQLSQTETFIGKASTTNFIECVRAVEGAAQAWAADTVLEVLFTATSWNKLLEHLLVEHGQDGKHTKVNGNTVPVGTDIVVLLTAVQTLTNKRLNSPKINENVALTATATELNTAKGFYNSLYRQALINGNFDVWQRGVTATNLGGGLYLADRWQFVYSADGGTLPTNVVVSRQALTAGDIPGSFYHYRIAPDGAGASLGVNSVCRINQAIENGTRLLCGLNKKVTVSFYARASVAGKRMGYGLVQNYGTGGSPTGAETIQGQIITLTSNWTKYTYTFTTNTLAGKTFGTANDDYLRPTFLFQWGTSVATTYFGGGTAETYGGSGTIDIAQVQLCAGDVALPFMPKSYEEESRACDRYCQAIETSATYEAIGIGSAASTTIAYINIRLRRDMRTTSTLSSATAGDWQLNPAGVGGIDVTAIGVESGFWGKNGGYVKCTVASGLTQYRPYDLTGNGTAGRKLVFEAEL